MRTCSRQLGVGFVSLAQALNRNQLREGAGFCSRGGRRRGGSAVLICVDVHVRG